MGQNLPLTFPLQPSYWRGASSGHAAKPLGGPEQPASHRLRSASSEDCVVAVSLRGLGKVYGGQGGDEKVALDALTLDMYQGHVTALLGARVELFAFL